MTRCPARCALSLILSLQLASPGLSQVGAQAPAQRKTPTPATKGTPEQTAAALSERQRAIHALNRLSFGPRPGDVDAVLAKGVDAWIEDQLHPESIDDSALNARIGPYATMRMNPKQLAQTFPSDGVIRQVIAGKRPMPDDPAGKLIYSVNVARLQQQDAERGTAANAAANAAVMNGAATATPPAPSPQDRARAIAERLLALPKEQRLAALEALPPEQLINFPNLLRGDQRDRLFAESSPPERETVRAFANPAGVVAYEIQQAKLMREIYSERQLLEVMTDFWFNHFNVYQYKNQCAYYTTAYERDVIRPHALGKFYDLLLATAQSPAMLMYLDNWLSIGPHSQAAGKNGQSGLNENYGRELMELHTLGVDGGYTQSDVTELARVLTGWTIAQPDDGGQFQFDPRRHDSGTKTFLGDKIYEGGSDEGMRALDTLAHHPSTARFVSMSIAIRFVSDDPPKSLVDRMAATFQSSDGDIREVLRTMFRSPEFWSPKAYGAKLKTPLEFVVSTVRATGANVVAPDALVQSLVTMGMQPYGMAVPTGYSMKSETWDNEGALLARINFSTALTQGKLPGVQFDPATLVAVGLLRSGDQPRTKAILSEKHTGLDLALAITEDTILPGELLPKDEAVIRKETQDPEAERSMAAPLDGLRLVAGFILASPEFQHR
ncbi:MAG TPA: DUF1800 domain-containing protein [Candidatus Acidoferrales bacterium]|nr:DUF1800 domain-containing protein [Candidatus Acidoferrales bacterium]